MASFREQLRRWLIGERLLLREMALILVAGLLVGLYFLENLDQRLAESERVHATALAVQTARAAGEYIAADDRVSLTVISRHTAALEPVVRVELLDTSQRSLAVAGPEVGAEKRFVERPVRVGNGDGDVVGRVRLWAETPGNLRQQTEAGFVLLVLCLLGLRVVATVLHRRLAGPGLYPEPGEGPAVSSGGRGAAEALPAVVLWLEVVNRRQMQARFTDSMLGEMLDEYRHCLEQVGDLYGGKVASFDAGMASMRFSGTSTEEAAFNALCAGQLFLRLSRDLGGRRKGEGRPALEFKLLVTSSEDVTLARACCEAGRPGRVQVPEDELTGLELDARVLYRPEQAIEIVSGERTLRIQPVEQLAQRYQKLISVQAEKLIRYRG